jgi:uncharacterized membrane protein
MTDTATPPATRRQPAPAPARTPVWQVVLAFLLLTGVYSAISLIGWRTLQSTSFDLAVFTQIVDDWAQLRIPHVELTGSSVLAAHHFSPALAVFAPVYALFPSPVTLLVQQAVVVAVGVVPLMRHAGRHGRLFAWAVAFAYGLAPGLCSLIGFDVHEVALAVPLLAFAAVALVERRHRAAVLWALALLLVKEDLGLTVAMVGVVVFLRGSRRLGAVTFLGSGLAAAFTMKWVLPHLDSAGYYYTDAFAPHSVGDAWRVLWTDWQAKARTVATLLLPVGFLALLSPVVLLALPTLGWRFLSDRPSFWTTGFQYDAVLVPVVTAALLDAARRLPRRVLTPVALLVVVLTALMVPSYDADDLLHADRWRQPARTAQVVKALEVIPDNARVAASNDLGPRLVSRTTLYFFGDTLRELGPVAPEVDLDRVDWIAYDTAYDTVVPTARQHLDDLLASGRFERVSDPAADRAGIIVARRVASGT